jgi:hypothetical protein
MVQTHTNKRLFNLVSIRRVGQRCLLPTGNISFFISKGIIWNSFSILNAQNMVSLAISLGKRETLLLG